MWAQRVVRSKQTSEWCERTDERTDERVAQYLRLDSWLFWPIVTCQFYCVYCKAILPTNCRKYFRRQITWMVGYERPEKMPRWADAQSRPSFYPDFLPWNRPDVAPVDMDVNSWVPLQKKAIGKNGIEGSVVWLWCSQYRLRSFHFTIMALGSVAWLCMFLIWFSQLLSLYAQPYSVICFFS